MTNSVQPLTALLPTRTLALWVPFHSPQEMNGKCPNVESDANLKTKNSQFTSEEWAGKGGVEKVKNAKKKDIKSVEQKNY
jgi:hypothetical protein